MRFHLLGMNHLPILKEIQPCAFTQKVYKMSKMLMSLGHEVYVYGVEGSVVPCTEFISVVTREEVDRSLGAYDWTKESFRTDFNNMLTSSQIFIGNAIREIKLRRQPYDFLLVSMGTCQKAIADAVGLYLTVEFGIGYRGSWAYFRAFESNFLRAYQYGAENATNGDIVDGRHYDRVIPNYFDPDDFRVTTARIEDPYICFVGRMTRRKGLMIAVDAAKAAGVKLIMAGQGAVWQGHTLKCIDEDLIDYGQLEYIGTVNISERNKLMGEAMATIVPTLYQEPFGGVNVESQLCGTPAIASNFGAFPETIRNEESGFLCDTLDDYVSAIKSCMEGDVCLPWVVRQNAEKYLMPNVAQKFEKWFKDLYEVYLSTLGRSRGWYQVGPDRPVPEGMVV